ncbi:MAG: MFS transporter, partial [Promethearchaeota archaeon]
MSKDEELKHETHGFLEINSYSLSQGLINFNTGAFGAYVFFFYETEVLLNVVLLAIVFSIYSVWDAINDPLLGSLMDRPYRFTRKWGRRFPFVAMAIFPWGILYIFLFTPPAADVMGGWSIFIYLLIILIAYDTFYTIWDVSSEALFPFKFRDYKERRKVSGTKAFWGIIGLVLGMVVPPLFVEYGNKQSYITQAIILGIIAVIVGALMLPGHVESKEIIEEYLTTWEMRGKRVSFIKALAETLKKKNFLLLILLHFTYTILTGLLIASLNYFIRYNLREDPDVFLIIMLGYIIVSLSTIPLWIKVSHKINDNRKMTFIGS